jgi:hypothetical protein
MPLQDHFRPPLDNITSWDGFHGGLPAMLVLQLGRILPIRYAVEPRVQIRIPIDLEMATFENDPLGQSSPTDNAGGTATALWAPAQPTLVVETELLTTDEYAVLIFDNKRNRRLVAAIEIVSPANKDRPEARRDFVEKCAALLKRGVAVSILDLVTTRHFNLYGELLESIDQSDPSLTAQSPTIYATTCRWRTKDEKRLLEAWHHPLILGQTLPTLPIWLNSEFSVPLDLEESYTETCRALRIGA